MKYLKNSISGENYRIGRYFVINPPLPNFVSKNNDEHVLIKSREFMKCELVLLNVSQHVKFYAIVILNVYL